MTDKLDRFVKFVVVKRDFWHHAFNHEVDAIAAAYHHMSHSGPVRVLQIVREVDIGEGSDWAPCEHCGRPIHNNTGCWWKPCREAHP